MIDDIEKIVDYNIDLDLLIQYFKDKEKFVGLITGLNNQANNIETALFEIRDNYTIDSAVGVQLDVLGIIQGEKRNGISDNEIYRDRIKARIVVNNGSGEFETIITYLRALCGATKVQTKNLGNLNLFIWTDITITDFIFSQLLKIVCSGVGVIISYGSINPFVFYGDNDGEGLGKLREDILEFSDGSVFAFEDDSVFSLLSGIADENAYGGELQSSIKE